MKHAILPNGNLLITATDQERRWLRELSTEPDFDSDNTMFDIFEPLTCDSELDWSRPECIGALTSAPILAIHGEDLQVKRGEVGEFDEIIGSDGDTLTIRNILQAWGFMDYAVISPQRRLMEAGQTEWQLGYDSTI